MATYHVFELAAAGHLQRLAGNIDTHENRVGHVPSPILVYANYEFYNRSGCKKGRSNSGTQCSVTGSNNWPQRPLGLPELVRT